MSEIPIIAVVDDDVAVRSSAANLIRSLGFKAIPFASGFRRGSSIILGVKSNPTAAAPRFAARTARSPVPHARSRIGPLSGAARCSIVTEEDGWSCSTTSWHLARWYCSPYWR